LKRKFLTLIAAVAAAMALALSAGSRHAGNCRQPDPADAHV